MKAIVLIAALAFFVTLAEAPWQVTFHRHGRPTTATEVWITTAPITNPPTGPWDTRNVELMLGVLVVRWAAIAFFAGVLALLVRSKPSKQFTEG